MQRPAVMEAVRRSCPGWRWSPLGWKSANPTELLRPLVFYSRQEQGGVNMWHQHTLTHSSSWWAVCVDADSHILVISQGILTHTGDIGRRCHVHIRNGGYEYEDRSVMRAAHHVRNINTTWCSDKQGLQTDLLPSSSWHVTFDLTATLQLSHYCFIKFENNHSQ